jgi:orotate phosphoribosyltransferase
MTHDDVSREVLALMREAGALLEGHFILSSGRHSPAYLQCARVLMDPGRAERLCRLLAHRVRDVLNGAADRIDVVASPALGGIVLGYELARQLGTTSIFTERVEGRFALRRGFAIEPGARVLVAEDVVTTGLSTRECMACLRAEGGDIVGAACLVDRSGGGADLGVPLVALADLALPSYGPDEVPPELASIPATKPGSRGIS